MPSGSEARAALTRVDLSDAGLDQLDVREFVNVEHLAMAGNRLPSLARVVGLQDLERLRTLNVARNALSSVDEVCFTLLLILKLILFYFIWYCQTKVARLLAFTSLFAIGVVGNPLCDVKHWRAKLVSQLPQLVCFYFRFVLWFPSLKMCWGLVSSWMVLANCVLLMKNR